MANFMSFSRAKNHLAFCPYSNYLKYVAKADPIALWAATEFGVSIHSHIAGLYRDLTSELPKGDRYDCFKRIPTEEYLLDDVLLVEGQNPKLWSDEKRAGLLTAALSKYSIVGIPDLVTQPNASTLVVTDYKTGKMRLSPSELASDAQMVLYRWLLEQNGYYSGRWIFNHCYVTQSGKNIKWVTAESTDAQYKDTIRVVLRQIDYVYQREFEYNHFPPVAGFDPQTCRICSYREVCKFSSHTNRKDV